ncbi:hypothetical protein MRX96_009671 [Rhipicephalus microplus]
MRAGSKRTVLRFKMTQTPARTRMSETRAQELLPALPSVCEWPLLSSIHLPLVCARSSSESRARVFGAKMHSSVACMHESLKNRETTNFAPLEHENYSLEKRWTCSDKMWRLMVRYA